MRRFVTGICSAALALAWVAAVGAEDRNERGDRVLGSVIGGLLGAPQAAPDAAYVEKERERLVTMLQSGEYVTSRQGEAVEAMVLGVPLTKSANVYTAKPIPPSQGR